MAAQIDYSYSTRKALPGAKADIRFDEVVTRRNEEADGVLEYGMAVQVGATPGVTVKVPVSGATAAQIDGVVMRVANTEEDKNGTLIVPGGAALGILKAGRIWARLASDAVPEYGKAAYVVTDGNEAGYFTSASSAASVYVKCASTDSGAKEVVADDTESPTSGQIKVAAVTPVQSGYTPAVGDYVVSEQIHGATLDIGASFGNEAEDGIAIIEL